ncbi:MAG: iron-sulfur cluster assembly accessory protein [Nitrospinota bacterium]|jgi:iron-sulfur cluster assembly protein|nr:iron-sulfur cluster assembly accessory protein [Nitrospinota bacterium]MDP6483405.1 iron-sulfur cluster assembly accessory protein [Nitrospinota bacterium]|tara:strand:+ start:176 stop:499 length:324 start_codon:yes stop_codon:yes gene_type:complete
MITLTETAVRQVKKLKEEQNLEDYALRVGIQGGGCSGISYTLGFDSEVKEKDKVFDIEGIKVVVDMKSLLYLGGTTLTYEESMMGGGFRFENPNAKRTCGCGSSFTA